MCRVLDTLSVRGTPALHLNEPAGGSCCDAGRGFVWRCYFIDMTCICLIKKGIYFELFRGRGCVEYKNMTSAKRKSTMSSLNPSIIQVGSFKCRADVPLLVFLHHGVLHLAWPGAGPPLQAVAPRRLHPPGE